MGENKSGKRIIAIAVSPKAYDEILTLKGERTWTRWLVELMLEEIPTNEILQSEFSELTKTKEEKPKAEPKAEKPKVELKPKKAKVKAEAKAEPQPEVEYGVVNHKTGGTPVDISKIGRHEADEVGEESGDNEKTEAGDDSPASSSNKSKARKKLKTETITQTVENALEDAKSEVSALAEEIGEWRDNMDGTGLENTMKYEEVSEAADSLEDLDSRFQYIEIEDDDIKEKEITYYWSHPYGRHIGRSWRAGMVVAALNAILEVLPDEDDTRGELEDIVSEIENMEFPSMY